MKLVSAIMPTRGRAEWARQALEFFLAQTYPEKELIILDDSDDPSFPVAPDMPGVTYRRTEMRCNIPVKRNACCEMARGEIICHFDSDDYSAPERMADQVALIEQSGKSVVGYHSMLFYSANPLYVAKYRGDQNVFAMGTSLMFKRDFWAVNRFPPSTEIAEDTAFVRMARKHDQLITAEAGKLMVARSHPGNTSEKKMRNSPFVPANVSDLPEGFPR